jgi:hypothetical protein
MAVGVPVTFGDFLKIEAKLRKHGFVEIHRKETQDTIVAHGLKSHRTVRGAEVGFKYFRNGYVVKVWTSCLGREVDQCRKEPLLSLDVVVSRPPEEDFGWVVLTDSRNHAEYFARSTKRTKNFVTNLLKRALITAQKVQNRPLCPKCKTFMEIHREPTGATYWECRQMDRHADGRFTFQNWDVGLGSKGKKAVEGPRNAYRRTHQKEKAEGRGQRRMAEIRIGWEPTRDPYPSGS